LVAPASIAPRNYVTVDAVLGEGAVEIAIPEPVYAVATGGER
jgi:hypothetical protein